MKDRAFSTNNRSPWVIALPRIQQEHRTTAFSKLGSNLLSLFASGLVMALALRSTG
jgi:hypothetical protein